MQKVVGCWAGFLGSGQMPRWLLEDLESPDKTGGGAVIVLRVAGVMRVHVIALNAPGEILEEDFVIEAAAHIDHQRVIDKRVGRAHVTNAGHGMNEGSDLSYIRRQPGAADNVVLPQAIAAIETAAVHNQAETGKAGEREILKGCIPAAITLLVNDVGELAVGDTPVNIPAGQKTVELCCHWN